MDIYEKIEEIYAKKFNSETTSKKSLGDFFLELNHAVNVKSNNVDKNNYSPNLISAYRLFNYLKNENNKISFIFVDYSLNKDNKISIIKDSGLVLIEHIDWSCLSIQAQGNGVIQLVKPLKVNLNQTREQFMANFKINYKSYIERERKKLVKLDSLIKS